MKTIIFNSKKWMIKMTEKQGKDDVGLLNEGDSSNTIQFNPLKHFFSQYFWILFLASFCIIGIKYQPVQESGIIHSAPIKEKWNDDSDPKWFGLLTDIHLNSVDRSTNYRFFNSISALANFSIDDLLITGDLVDNWGEIHFSKYGHQHKPDYEYYHENTQEYYSKFKNVFDLAGNHDEFGIYKFQSPNHNFIDFTKFFTRHNYQRVDEFWASSAETDNFIFVLLNPYRYPSPHAKFDYFVRPTTEILDFTQKELEKHKNAKKPIIVACHYPMHFWLNTAVSSTKKTFIEIIKESNASIYLSGHIHPRNSVFQHHDGFLEVAASDVQEHSSFCICTFDNGRVSFHTFKKAEEAKIIMTHPVPVRHISNRNVFNERDTSIRLLVFGNKSLNIKVRGAAEDEVKYQREIKPDVYLYSLPISLDSGYHTIEFYGDYENEIDFFVGSKMASFTETRYGSVNLFGTGIVYCIIFTIMILFILLPVNLTLDNFVDSCIFANGFCFYTFGGFLTVRSRIQTLPKWLRIELFLAFLAPLFLPISLIEDEGHIGFNCLYGFYFEGTFVYDIWGQLICGVYELLVVLASALFASGMAISQPWHSIFILDACVGFGGYFVALNYLNTTVKEASGPLTNISPLFVFIPFILHVSILFWRFSAPAEFFRDWRNPKNNTKKKVD
ncbi:Ser/Thr protein phosphatase [Tritrichomonas foetus]|uniref:Ser/Thr protein phosphatase n=1 Tax=Tritrichomonas foetus TaxID=1144522 RepID=A0A1J4KKG0_9EUKA|nr:Ser/Thr protein phosphatase [Tritrichomonas foetus]|eukprot:OHT09845.1 Ser/Thr protein phosphatase [Tritrichomonas foetus]